MSDSNIKGKAKGGEKHSWFMQDKKDKPEYGVFYSRGKSKMEESQIGDKTGRLWSVIETGEVYSREYPQDVMVVPSSGVVYLHGDTRERSNIHSPILYRPVVKENYEIKIADEVICYLDYRHSELFEEINNARYILELENDFDDEGSEAYEKETWKRAIKFICSLFDFAINRTNKKVAYPKIYHGPNGSIDLLWEKERFNLLVNIPKIDIKLATYYGYNLEGENVKGSFIPSNINHGLIFLLSLI